MSSLAATLQNLITLLEDAGLSPPTRTIGIVELRHEVAVDAHGRARVQRNDLMTPAAYENRFDELMSAGLPWINVSCAGEHDGMLIVTVELPRPEARTSRSGGTSVNLSGPTAKTIAHEWRASETLLID